MVSNLASPGTKTTHTPLPPSPKSSLLGLTPKKAQQSSEPLLFPESSFTLVDIGACCIPARQLPSPLPAPSLLHPRGPHVLEVLPLPVPTIKPQLTQTQEAPAAMSVVKGAEAGGEEKSLMSRLYVHTGWKSPA